MLPDDDRRSQELIVARNRSLIELAQSRSQQERRPASSCTFDIMFDDPRREYERVKKSGVINAHRIAEIYRVRLDDRARVRGRTIPRSLSRSRSGRPVGSGDVTDRDVYGCQQHVPLTDDRDSLTSIG
jgi:hypothetical protein